MKHSIKILLAIILNLTLSVPTYAEIIKQKALNFKFNSEKLMKGDIYYSYRLLSPKEVKNSYPEITDLDTIGALRKTDALMVSKIVSVIEKPIGFFDHKQVIDPDFLSHLMPSHKLKKITDDAFKVGVLGKKSNQFIMKVYFDSDDVSTLPDSISIRAITAAKKMDIIAQSAPAIILKEFTNYDHHQHGTVMITSYIPLKENKTLSITYQITAIKKSSISKELKKSHLTNIAAIKKLTDSYKVK